MRAEERENHRYKDGAENPIGREEGIMFSLLPLVGAGTQRTLLDVGCGIGTIALELQKRGYVVKGIDFSSVAVEKSRERGLDAILSDVDRDGLKFPDRSFDVVWAGDVIEHVFDPIYLIEEVARVLKSEGSFLLTVPNNFNLGARTRVFVSGRSVQSAVYRKSRQCKHHTFFSWELLSYMLQQAGLEPRRMRCVCRVPWVSQEVTTESRTLGALFGRVFVVEAGKR